MSSSKLWGGRFGCSTAPELEKLNCSIDFDKRLYAEDIAGSRAYALALRKIDLLTDTEASAICSGLDKIKTEWDNDEFSIKPCDEDIHTAIERRLKELIGEPATKLHCGRSRNDQVVTDMRLWMMKAICDIGDLLRDLIAGMLMRATNEIDFLMPGYTHLQRAQPVRWSHWLLSHAWNFQSDTDKLTELFRKTSVMPLGSGALAGNPFNIDRYAMAQYLGFQEITHNSMQAVADRDFIADFLYWASLLGIHLSRLAEDLIIFSTNEFHFVQIDDAYSTGSSLMPQKRNPDSLELLRGIGGSLFGYCTSFMMTLKGIPSTYNKDLQNDKENMFGAYDKVTLLLRVAMETIKTLKLNVESCQRALSTEMLATDLAYYLVKKSVPFRMAHHLAGRAVAEAEMKGILLSEMKLEDLKQISEYFQADVSLVWNFENSVEQYKAAGGTSKESVINQIEILSKWLRSFARSNSKQILIPNESN